MYRAVTAFERLHNPRFVATSADIVSTPLQPPPSFLSQSFARFATGVVDEIIPNL
jgi:hypothetical protein